MTTLEPITKLDQAQEIESRLAKNGEVLLAPTHTLYRDGRIIGASSIGSIPMVHWWFDQDSGQALSSVRGLNAADKILQDAGFHYYQTIVPNRSPFMPVMDRLGYVKPFTDDGTLFVKQLTHI